MGMIELGRMREAQKRHLPQPGYSEEKLLPVVSRLSLEGWRGVTKVTKQRMGVCVCGGEEVWGRLKTL